MSWRDKIARKLMEAMQPAPAATRGQPSGMTERYLREHEFNPQAATEDLQRGLVDTGRWGQGIRSGEIPMVIDENSMYESFRKATPADANWATDQMKNYEDSIKFLQQSQPIDPWGVQ